MKFKLLIEPKKEELVQAQVYQENEFTNKLKLFVLTNGNSNQIAAYDDKDCFIFGSNRFDYDYRQ